MSLLQDVLCCWWGERQPSRPRPLARARLFRQDSQHIGSDVRRPGNQLSKLSGAANKAEFTAAQPAPLRLPAAHLQLQALARCASACIQWSLATYESARAAARQRFGTAAVAVSVRNESVATVADPSHVARQLVRRVALSREKPSFTFVRSPALVTRHHCRRSPKG
jgi:hypothetical protein